MTTGTLVTLARSLTLLATLGAVPMAAVAAPKKAAVKKTPACAADNGGLTLPDGFCAVVVGRELGQVRHLAIAPNGDIFAAIAGKKSGKGGLMVLRDANGDGLAETVKKHGELGGNSVLWAKDAVYFAGDDQILRFPWKAGSLDPSGPPETIVKDLPVGGHSTKTLVLDPKGDSLLVAVGSRTNSCQIEDRKPKSPGEKPCAELATRAGVFRFDARKKDQTVDDGKRFATGLRNPTAIALDPKTGKLYGATHGRDQLSEHWGYSKEDSAENPSEEFGLIEEGADFGWPYCYFDPRAKKKVQNPEYGGDGKVVGDCDKRTQPLIGFPAHWAPIALAFYTATQFPEGYRGGAFLSWHGSWNRAPLPQAGFRVVHIPFRDGKPTGEWTDFVTPTKSATAIRPTGLAVGPDGSLYLGADADGMIWRVLAKAK